MDLDMTECSCVICCGFPKKSRLSPSEQVAALLSILRQFHGEGARYRLVSAPKTPNDGSCGRKCERPSAAPDQSQHLASRTRKIRVQECSPSALSKRWPVSI